MEAVAAIAEKPADTITKSDVKALAEAILTLAHELEAHADRHEVMISCLADNVRILAEIKQRLAALEAAAASLPSR